MIKVKELIEFLQTQNAEAVVLYRRYSDFDELRLKEIKSYSKEEIETETKKGFPYGNTPVVFMYNGHYLSGYYDWKKVKDEPIEPVDALVLPGN